MTDVIGFITPCDVCGRKALTVQPLDTYVCPPCGEVAEPIGQPEAVFHLDTESDWFLRGIQG
jgi:hypothetical protein